jgi:hypothetical protein
LLLMQDVKLNRAHSEPGESPLIAFILIAGSSCNFVNAAQLIRPLQPEELGLSAAAALGMTRSWRQQAPAKCW